MGLLSYVRDRVEKARDFASELDKITINAYNDALVIDRKINNFSKKTLKELWTNYKHDVLDTIDYALSSAEKIVKETTNAYREFIRGNRENQQEKTIPANQTIDDKISQTQNDEGLESITSTTSTIIEQPGYNNINTNYTTSINDAINKYEGNVKEIAETLSGAKTYSSEDQKKKAWKWTDRIRILEEQYATKTFTEEEKRDLEELKDTVKKNKYLRYKKKEEYEQVTRILDELTGGKSGPP